MQLRYTFPQAKHKIVHTDGKNCKHHSKEVEDPPTEEITNIPSTRAILSSPVADGLEQLQQDVALASSNFQVDETLNA